MSIAPLGTILTILSVVILSEAHVNSKDIFILLFALILPLLLIAFIMLYLQNQYLTRFIFDSEKNLLHIIKKRTEAKNYNLTNVQSIISKTIKTNPGCKYKLVFVEAGDNSRVILNEDTPFGAGHWEAFSEKLSKIIGVPLRKEYWVESLNGDLSLIPHEDRIANKKRGLLILSVPLITSFIGEIGYKIVDTFQALVLNGFSIVLINIGLTFVYALFNRDRIGYWAANHFTLNFSILTLSIPYTFFYLCFVFVLSGFRLPSGF
jgi:hypothetical protein